MVQNLTEQAYETILDNITSLRYFPGQKVSEKEVENSIKIGRTPVREALLRLRQDGLIKVVPQSGTYISKINLNRVSDAILIRKNIESEVIDESCAREHSRLESIRLMQLIEEQREAAKKHDVSSFLKYSDQFHNQFFIDTDHKFLWSWLNHINIYFYRVTTLSLKLSDENWEKAIREQEELLDAVINNDPEKAHKAFEHSLDVTEETERILLNEYPNYFYPDSNEEE